MNFPLPFIIFTLLATLQLAASPASPANSSNSDADRAERITRFLAESPRMEGSRLEVEVHEHIATLRGEVRNLDQADWAAATIFATDEVYGAVQQISLIPSPLSPGDLEEELQHIFAHTPALEGSRISPMVSEDRVLTISGQAGTYDELQAAREIASRIDGLRQIVVTAAVNPLVPRRSAAIEAQLALHQLDDPLLAHLPVEFRLDQGHLTIRGRVGNADQRDRLVSQSMLTGVMNCDTQRLRIDPELVLTSMSDKQYFPADAAKVMTLVLDADPRVDASRIRVEIENGYLHLRGDVPNEVSRQAAIQNCRGLPGILGTRNQLSVSPALSQF